MNATAQTDTIREAKSMYRYADRMAARRSEQQSQFGTYVHEVDPDGLIIQPVEVLLAGRTLYKGGQQERTNALEAYKDGAICFLCALHDITHVAGRWISAHKDFDNAVKAAEAVSLDREDVTIYACAPGWGFPECELGRWSAGRLVVQSYFQVSRPTEKTDA